jgi:hypothetical protein
MIGMIKLAQHHLGAVLPPATKHHRRHFVDIGPLLDQHWQNDADVADFCRHWTNVVLHLGKV